MSNQKLSESDIRKIQEAVLGLKGSALSRTIDDLVKEFHVGKQRIYEITKIQRIGRKSRSDKGNRKANLAENPFLKYALHLILTKSVNPKQAYEKAKQESFITPVSFETFKRYLKENQLWNNTKPAKIKKTVNKKPIIIILDDDVSEVFNDSKVVNNILRSLIPCVNKH
jgi:hypothetical protein